MKLRATPIGTGLPAQLATATAIPIRGIGPVFILQEWSLGRRRIGVALQVRAVCVAVGIRRSRRLIASWLGTSRFRRHRRARGLHDLPDALSCQADTQADRGEGLTGYIPGHDGDISTIGAARPYARTDASKRSSCVSLRSESSALATHAAGSLA